MVLISSLLSSLYQKFKKDPFSQSLICVSHVMVAFLPELIKMGFFLDKKTHIKILKMVLAQKVTGIDIGKAKSSFTPVLINFPKSLKALYL